MTVHYNHNASHSRHLLLIAVCLMVASSLAISGCDSVTDFNEINENPNNPVTAPSDQILTGLLSNFSYTIIGNTAPRITSLWVQQTAQNTDNPDRDVYNIPPSGPNNLWTFDLWAGVMKDAREMQEAARSEGNTKNVGIAQVMEAWGWMVAADLWGQIPVEEAFQVDNPTPAYNSQEVAYDTVFAKLESARENLQEENVEALGGQDLLYGGDAQKWTSLAWALEARAHIHLTESGYGAGLDGGSGRQARAQAALGAAQNAFPNGNADNAVFGYPGGQNGENPWYQYTIQGVWILDFQMSAQYVGLLKNRGDARLGIQARQVGAVDANVTPPNAGAPDFSRVPFDPAAHLSPSDDTYLGFENGSGDGVSVSDVSSLGEHYSAADASLTWFRYAEIKFIEAEANLILGNGGAARQAFEDGLRASLRELDVQSLNGVDQSFVDSFVSDRLAAYDSASDKLEEVINEKYIANFLLLEPYNDWRRTGYPELDPVPGAVTDNGEIALRFPYPESELNNNADNVPVGDIGGTGIRSLDTPVGWDR